MNSIIKLIPNTITCMNLLCGCIAIIYGMSGNFKHAFLFIILAAVFDFLDGFAARLLKAYSSMGKELDSLADMVSFGVAPAIMMFTCSKILVESNTGLLLSTSAIDVLFRKLLIFMPLSIAVFSGLRLAKFNIDTRQTENFIGLATPSCAMICGSMLYASEIYSGFSVFLVENTWFIPALSVVLSYLLICELGMFSFKFKNLSFKDNAVRFIFMSLSGILGIFIIILGYNWSLWVLGTFVLYILINLVIPFVCVGKNRVILPK